MSANHSVTVGCYFSLGWRSYPSRLSSISCSGATGAAGGSVVADQATVGHTAVNAFPPQADSTSGSRRPNDPSLPPPDRSMKGGGRQKDICIKQSRSRQAFRRQVANEGKNSHNQRFTVFLNRTDGRSWEDLPVSAIPAIDLNDEFAARCSTFKARQCLYPDKE